VANTRHSKAGRFVQQRLFSGLSAFVELERRIAGLPDEKSRGDAFEVFAEAYLATERKHDAETVWPLPSVPGEVLGSLQLAMQDYGVDGVLKTRLGKFSAYQVKFRAGRQPLTWRELSTFMGLADSPNIHSRILLTNCDDLPSVLNDRRGFFCIRGSDLDRLEAEDFKTIEAWLADAAYQAPKKNPLRHQAEALDKITPAFKEHDRASAIMACGTGKTLVALWAAEKMQAQRIFVLLPSLALLRQTLHEWMRETRIPSLAYLCVCSDPTVKTGLDAIDTKQSELDFQVSTDSASVREFLDAEFAGTKIIFSTYQSASVVGAAMKPGESFDFAVFDEAHKTAGREGRNFAFALDDKNLSIRKRLFVTATPRHYNPLARNKDGESQLVFSMDSVETYGPQVFRLPFSEAAKRSIICRYKVIISVISSQQVTNDLLSRGEVLVNNDPIRARQVANQIALADAVAKHGVNKIFTFHSTVNSAASFTCPGNEGVVTHLPDFKTLHVNGAMPTVSRERVMREFRDCKRGIISNARCLTEGVDVPAVDMVAFLAPRRSRVDIVQATGRAMRKADNKTAGYILVPLYLEQAANETVEQAVLRSDFSEVWEVLQSLQEQDEVLDKIICEMRQERGRTKGFDDSRFREHVTISGPEISLDVLRQTITAACLDAIGEKWFERYGQLRAYQKEHGNCDMPARWPANQKLATWVVNQRVLKKEGKLEQDKINLLDKIGFMWSPHETTWREQYLALMGFWKRFGHCRVPQNWKENKPLAYWIKTQRHDYVRGELSSERIALLEKIGFEWWLGLPTWDHRFAELCAFKEKFKHTRVPVKWPENPLLGRWVSSQRRKHTTGELRKKYEDRLNAIGFEWRAPNNIQNTIPLAKRIESLLAHKTEHGHLTVSQRNKKYLGLASWMTEQRAKLKNKTLPEEIKRQLDAIGFPWTPAALDTDKLWFEIFARYKSYAAENGVRTVKVVDDETRKLNRWVLTQRKTNKKGELSDVRFRALDGIGFIWQINRRKIDDAPLPAKSKITPLFRPWDEMFSELVEFYKLHGHCNVPLDWPANPELARWVNHQRITKRQDRLTAEQVQRLDEIGFAWSASDGDWDATFATLAEYLRPMHNGKPRNAAMSLELKRWMMTQRRLKKHGELEPEREQKLTRIGFEWQPYSRQWDEMFHALRKFHGEYGHCRVPGRWSKNPKLASWVATQRARKLAGQLSAERISRLDEIGFAWRVYGLESAPAPETLGVHEAGWNQMLSELQAYKDEHHNCKVPAQWPTNPRLARWVATQRATKKSGKLNLERAAALDAIGFEWVIGRGQAQPASRHQGIVLANAQLWEERFLSLQQYKQAHGNCLVPQRWKEDRRLAGWVSDQRIARNKNRLDAERVRRLDELGFGWNPVGTKWEAMFQQLVEFKNEYGHTNVPQRSGKNAALGTWVRNQRGAKRDKRPIMVERAKRLDAIGFMWTLVETVSWEDMFAALVEFKNTHGHCNVPQKSSGHIALEQKRLGKWVNSQRTANTRGKLAATRKQKLDAIGFVWNLRPNFPSTR
jgi:superfamily II DNA or RNA helicase